MTLSKSKKNTKEKSKNKHTRKVGENKSKVDIKTLKKILPAGKYSICGNWETKKYPNGIKVIGHASIKPHKFENDESISIESTIHALDPLSNKKIFSGVRKTHFYIKNNKFHSVLTGCINDKLVSELKGESTEVDDDKIVLNYTGHRYIIDNDKVSVKRTINNINGNLVYLSENKDKFGKIYKSISILTKK